MEPPFPCLAVANPIADRRARVKHDPAVTASLRAGPPRAFGDKMPPDEESRPGHYPLAPLQTQSRIEDRARRMVALKHRSLRRRLRRILLRLRHQPIEPRQVTLSDIDFVLSWIGSDRAESRRLTHKRLEPLIQLTVLGVGCVGYHSIALQKAFTNPNAATIVPQDPTCRTEPHIALWGLFSSITQHALAILYLVESGLEPSARALLRILHELSWLTILVSADPKKMALYVAPKNFDEERAAWKQHFNSRALIDGMAKVERTLRLRMKGMRRERAHQYHFYSLGVHHASIATYLSSFAQPFGWPEKRLGLNIFGRASRNSADTLELLNEVLAHTLFLFRQIVQRLHGLKFPSGDSEWAFALGATDAYLRLWLTTAKRPKRRKRRQ